MRTYVLIAEDTEDTRTLLQFTLEQAGFQVIAVRDGQEAIDLLSHYIPDLIIVDLLMPGVNGIELIRQLRAHPAYAQVPIVVFSAYADGYAEETTAAGATLILQKPMDVTELPQILNSLLPKAEGAA